MSGCTSDDCGGHHAGSHDRDLATTVGAVGRLCPLRGGCCALGAADAEAGRGPERPVL